MLLYFLSREICYFYNEESEQQYTKERSVKRGAKYRSDLFSHIFMTL